MQEIGDGGRRHGRHVDAGDFDGAGDQFLVAAADMLAEDDADAGQLFDFEADGQFVVEPRRLQVFATGLARDEADAGVGGQLRLVVAG